jgi:hypothetical protein
MNETNEDYLLYNIFVYLVKFCHWELIIYNDCIILQ